MKVDQITTVGVVGAGTIGRGVAQSFAEHGFRVRLIDTDGEALKSAVHDIAELSRLQVLYHRTIGSGGDPTGAVDRILPDTDVAALADADFVVENVTEDWEVKRAVYAALDAITRPEVVLAVNTSAIPITRVAATTSRPDRLVGLHFMNPVPLMPMVEVMRGHHTSQYTLELSMQLLARLGKEGVVVGDFPGFITNRVLMLTINEAIFSVQDGVASALDIDRIFKGCFGHKMGPLETGDLIGLDTILNSIDVLYEGYRDSKYRPAPLLQQMVDAGLLGRKSGQGFYTYPGVGGAGRA
jgi:3-hydroxybutyryl-CoA dehydrogenase